MNEDNSQEGFQLQRFLQTYRKSEIIFEQGSPGSEMFLIRKGKIRLSVKQGELKEVVLAILNPGDFFGEMALLDDSPRSATASSLEDDAELFVLDRVKFLFIVRQQPEFALSLMHALCQRVRNLNQQLSAKGESQ